jgi:hypothetical protein
MALPQMTETQKKLLYVALTALLDGQAKAGKPMFILDILLSSKEDQEAIIRELAGEVIRRCMTQVQHMQAIMIEAKPVEIPPMPVVELQAQPPVKDYIAEEEAPVESAKVAM